VTPKSTELLLDDAFWFQEGPGVRKWQFQSNGIKLLNVANITNYGLDLSKTGRHLAAKEIESRYSHFLVDEGDLVIASSGISIDADGFLRTRGAFIDREHLPLCMNTSTIRFKAKDGISDLRFLKHWLNTQEFRAQITREVTGIAQKNFGPSHLKQLKITLPPLDEQRRIAAILDKADTLRTKRREAIAKLDQLLQSVFLEMFGDPVANPYGWPEGSIDIVTRQKSDVRCGPFGTQLKVGELVESGVPLLGIENVYKNHFVSDCEKFVTREKAQKLSSFAVKPSDVLITRMGTIGRACIVPEGIGEARISYHLFRVRPDPNRCLPAFLSSTICRSGTFQAQLKKLARGAIMSGLNTSLLRKVKFLLPPVDMQERYLRVVEAVEGKKRLLVHSGKKNDELFKSLQQDAFGGRL
jgi:type I restriction enzyme S subunit